MKTRGSLERILAILRWATELNSRAVNFFASVDFRNQDVIPAAHGAADFLAWN